MSTSQSYNPGTAELGRKNQPGGYVGIDGSGDVLGTFAQRRDTAANIAGIVLKNGELACTTDTQETFLGDGVTEGGLFLYQVPQIATLAVTISASTKFSGGTPAFVELQVQPGVTRIHYGLLSQMEFGSGLQYRLTSSALSPWGNSTYLQFAGDASAIAAQTVTAAGLTTTINNGPAELEPVVFGDCIFATSAGTLKFEVGFVSPSNGDLLSLELVSQRIRGA